MRKDVVIESPEFRLKSELHNYDWDSVDNRRGYTGNTEFTDGPSPNKKPSDGPSNVSYIPDPESMDLVNLDGVTWENLYPEVNHFRHVDGDQLHYSTYFKTVAAMVNQFKKTGDHLIEVNARARPLSGKLNQIYFLLNDDELRQFNQIVTRLTRESVKKILGEARRLIDSSF